MNRLVYWWDRLREDAARRRREKICPETRGRVAARASAFYRGKVSLSDLMSEFEDSRDPQVMELLDMIEHEPGMGTGWGHASPEEHHRYLANIQELIDECSRSKYAQS